MPAVWQAVWEPQVSKSDTDHGRSLTPRPDPTVRVVSPRVSANSYPAAVDLYFCASAADLAGLPGNLAFNFLKDH